MALEAGEPAAGPWRVEPVVAFAASVLDAAGPADGRPLVVAVDGRSASGKTMLASRLQAAIPCAATVHTDDIAWFHSMFDWVDLMAAGVLESVRRGEPVVFRPPAWERRGRHGAVEVPAGAAVVLLEGVGAGRRELAHLVDAVVYVQSDSGVRARRDEHRMAIAEAERDVLERWMAEEVPFVAEQRPWDRACAIVAGTPELAHDPIHDVVVAAGLAARAPSS